MKTRTNPQTRRAGFTLIELLTVIAIIAVLAALGAGAFFRVRANQQEKLTAETVTKLQKTLRQQWTAALDNAKKEPVPDILKAYCQNDPDKTAAVWAYLHLRKNFPETVLEARSPVQLPPLPPTFLSATTIFPPQQVFLDQVPAAAGSLSADEQSAICLYVSLTAINRRGMESGITDNMTINWPQGLPAASQYKVFSDTFGLPIAFRRMLSNTEMQVAPFSKPGLMNRDPLDPLGKLKTLPIANRTALQLAVGGGRVLGDITYSNFMPTVFSYGMNKKSDFSGPDPIGDDVLGYRLETEGKIN